ncbi:periplasmic heavy metal sensor [Oceanibacterium hippocampi]|uniref:Zinc resistance-associated protein n=1 Tax=Oceanibacterium hippocampi TaxID=745714 RepID=A0A1Y5SU74_9PROT|nr:periplasmic heavy metal sensor [Oceanibacterium hippocampi]SLN45255.1 hypothetical protein OCH7691_01939 [Oceanibacterium hippocampi]
MPGPKTRYLAVALVLSVAVNLLLGGLAAGHWLRAHDHGDRHRGGPHFLERLESKLDGKDRQALDRLQAVRDPVVDERIDALRAARRDFQAALAAEPFDRATVAAAQAEMRARSLAAQQAIHETMLDVMEVLSPEGRELYRETMTRPRRHGGPRP